MSLLAGIHRPDDLKALSREQLVVLAQEVRDRLIEGCSVTGGHIGASLGVVELTIAILREFDSPTDKVVWDVGHQAYAWKLLTGRNDRFTTLRSTGGLSGFLKRDESAHDQFGAGHAGTAMSAAFGMATARDLQGGSNKVIAVVGDGALTCGLSYEALNNAGHSERDIILIVNDNGMSISPNVGAISKLLGGIVANPRTNRVREAIKKVTLRIGDVLARWRRPPCAKRRGIGQEPLSEGILFGARLPYFGPIDCHDLDKLRTRWRSSATCRTARHPCAPEKGKGSRSPRPTARNGTALRPMTGHREARKKPVDRPPGRRCSANHGRPR